MRYVKELSNDVIDLLYNKLKNAPKFRERQRCQILLMSHQHLNVLEVSLALNISRDTVERTLNRFESLGVSNLKDLPRSGRPPRFSCLEKKT